MLVGAHDLRVDVDPSSRLEVEDALVRPAFILHPSRAWRAIAGGELGREACVVILITSVTGFRLARGRGGCPVLRVPCPPADTADAEKHFTLRSFSLPFVRLSFP